MILETSTCQEIARYLLSLKGSVYLETPELQSRHLSIQNALDALAGFFTSLAVMAENTEAGLLNSMPFSGGGFTGVSLSADAGHLIPDSLQGKVGKASVRAHYAYASASFSWEDENVSARATVNAVEGTAKASVSLKLFSNGQFDPSLKAAGELSASALNITAEGRTGSEMFGASGTLQGEAGALYLKASADISKDGIDMEGKVGAAALRGSCVLALDILGLKLSITFSGTVGGIEASASYRHTTNTWEAGIGAAVGIGGSMKLGLSWD